MNGVYLHIPYCKKVCYYCDFHFTVSLKLKDRLLQAMHQEIGYSNPFGGNQKPIDTIYFGGGTPSILNPSEIEQLLNQVHRHFPVSDHAEITIEVNPDDLSKPYLLSLKALGFNRLSIGVQSFSDNDLHWMNRRHNAQEAENAVLLSQDAGFDNLSIDLIYGIPASSPDQWIKNIRKFQSLDIPHLSAYHLTIEPKTVFGYYKRKGSLTEIHEDQSVEQYTLLIDEMRRNGYHHYEISNFCKEGFYSRHNVCYWKQGRYLGIGPSAHSYDGTRRRWNVSVHTRYINSLEQHSPWYEEEILTPADLFNDYLLTGLRTYWGIQLTYIRENFGEKFLDHLEKELVKYHHSGSLVEEEGSIKLTEEGMFISDQIISSLFYIESNEVMK